MNSSTQNSSAEAKRERRISTLRLASFVLVFLAAAEFDGVEKEADKFDQHREWHWEPASALYSVYFHDRAPLSAFTVESARNGRKPDNQWRNLRAEELVTDTFGFKKKRPRQ